MSCIGALQGVRSHSVAPCLSWSHDGCGGLVCSVSAGTGKMSFAGSTPSVTTCGDQKAAQKGRVQKHGQVCKVMFHSIGLCVPLARRACILFKFPEIIPWVN